MNGKLDSKRSVGGSIVLLGLIFVLAALPAMMGCETDAGADTSGVLSPESGSTLGAMSPPTLADITAGAGLSAAQSQALAPALARWRDQAQTMDRRRDGRRKGSGPGGPGTEPPMHAFLQDAAGSLDTDGFVAVVGYLAQRREAHREEMQAMRAERQAQRQGDRLERRALRRDRQRDGTQDGIRDRQRDRIHNQTMQGDGPRRGMRGDGPGFHRDGPGAGMRALLSDLDLTDAQRTALRDAMRAAHETLRAMHREIADGGLTADGARTQAQGAVDALRQALQAGLTAGQADAVTARLKERAHEMAERRLDHVDMMGERQDAFLVQVLGLDDGQAAALEQARIRSQDRVRTLLGGIQGGSVTFPDAVYESVSIHKDTDAAIRALLNQDQVRKFDALQELRRGGGPRLMGIYL
jgi:hypothetical protein